ncbi:MAG: hypothetical protein DRG78_16130 [Epsilonproteobacteria bacterium]|nr:MAG: hypothetical protein DRG78_16130 [Campylobacterota bacterium]
MGLGGVMKKIFTPTKFKKRVFDPEMISIEDIKLPKIIDQLDSKIIKSMVKEEISTYKSLGYKDKSLGALEVKTYHSFQVGCILKYLQLDYDLFIPNNSEIFPSFVTNYPFESLQTKVFEVINNYDKTIAKDPSGPKLINDISWSPLDVTYLLYYLTVYKNK